MKCPCCHKEELIPMKHNQFWYVCVSCGVKVMKEHIKEDKDV